MFFDTEKIYLKKQESASFHAEANPADKHLQREKFTNTSQKPAVNTPKSSENQIFPNPPAETKVMVSDISAPEIGARSQGGTKPEPNSLEQVASPSLSIKDNHRGVLVNRCPPKETLDPLSTFMMLRAEQAVPVAAAQKTVHTPGFCKYYLNYFKCTQ